MMTNMDKTRGPTYIISMDIEEDIKALKAKIGYDLQMNLTNSQVLVLTQKLSDNETLSSVCGSYKGMIQVQFSVEHGDGNPHIQIYDVRRPNEVIYREETAGTGEEPKMDWKSVKRRLQTSEWVASNDFERLRKASGMPQNPRQWSSNQVQVWFEWAKKRFEFPEEVRKNLDVRGENLLSMNDEALKRVFPTDQKSPFDMHLQILRKTKVVAVPRGPSDEGAQSNSPEETSSQHEIELLPPPSTEFAREEIRSTENVAETLDHLAPSSSRNACLIPPSSQSNLEEENSIFQVSQTVLSGHSLQLWQFLLLLLTDPKHVDIIRWCGEDGEFRFEKPDVVAKLWGERKGKSNMNYEKLSRAIRYYYDCDEKIVSKVFGKNYTYRFELDLRDVLGYSSQEIRDQIEEYNSADRTR